MRRPGPSRTPLEEEILQVCGYGMVAELVVLLDKLRAESTKLQDYRPDKDYGHFVLSMLLESIKECGRNLDVLRYLVDTFNPTRYGSQGNWVYTKEIACSALGLDLEHFRLLWQYNNDLATRKIDRIAHPLGLVMLSNNLPLAEFLMQHGADPLENLLGTEPMSENDWEYAPSVEMKELLKKHARTSSGVNPNG